MLGRAIVRGARIVPLLCGSQGKLLHCLPQRGVSSLHHVTRPLTTSQLLSSSEPNTSTSDARNEAKQKARRISFFSGATCAFLGASYILYLQLKARADEGSEATSNNSKEEASSNGGSNNGRRKRLSFHDQKVVAYENRIRAYSTPDKIFRYFATLKVTEADGSRHIYMTPNDFIRSITPGMMQPQEYGLDYFRPVTVETVRKEGLAKVDNSDSVFHHMGHHSLISFSDFLFLLTIIATPVRNFQLAFKMFDLNGDGDVELSEFQTVRSVLMNATSMGSKHRDHFINGNVDKSVGGALVKYFFGPKGDQKLTLEQFQKFHSQLCMELLEMEFNRFDPEDGIISETDFAHFVVDYAPLKDQKKKKIVKRVKKKYNSSESPPSPGISYKDVVVFNEIMDNLADIDVSLGLYYAAGVSITPSEFRRTCEAVIDTKINDHLLDVLFTLFDDNGDGELSRGEFITIVNARNSHGLQRSRELGLAKLFSAIGTCSAKTVKDQIGLNS